MTLSFSTGEFVALTGESGSGKSTLAHVLGGILPYESGELYIYGQPTSHYDAYDWSKYRRDLISFISQSYGILPGNTVSENVESALILSGLSKDEAHTRADAILEEVELTEFKRRKAGKLSSGQKQRLSIARALAKPSKILIADEPTGNLDRENSEKIISLLKKASRDRLVILITHEFEEAKDVATRRIILSDGAVVTDAKLADVEAADEQSSPAEEKKATKQKPLAPYVCRLTLKSRPIFTAILCLLLAVTMFISFVFVGNFIVALDDTSTRIYKSDAFANGSPKRLVVMHDDGSDLTEDDHKKIIGTDHVESIERYGYVSDIAYHYREGIDYGTKEVIVLLPGYDSILKPDLYEIQTRVELYRKGFSYMRTLPYTGEDILTDGRAPTGTYEIVSADPDYNVGDSVTVYLRNSKEWSIGSYFEINFTVVGTTDFGEGFYFSDELASALSFPSYPLDVAFPHRPWGMKFVFVPYDPQFELQIPQKYEVVESEDGGTTVIMPSESDEDEEFVLQDHQYIAPLGANQQALPSFLLTETDKELSFSFTAYHKEDLTNVMFITEAAFDKVVKRSSDQISVFIEDYSYTERVLDDLKAEGYIAISPYQLGATEVDEELARERLVTLGVCAATFVIAFVLQLILLRTMFASLYEYYKLMSSTGLTAKTAFSAVTMLLLFATVIGEAVGVGTICILNSASVERIVNIFKYLDEPLIAVLFSLHFVTVMISLAGILVSLKKAVFGKGKSSYDIDFTLMEEDA